MKRGRPGKQPGTMPPLTSAERDASLLIPAIWRAHDDLEDFLTETARMLLAFNPRLTHVVSQVWQAHDLIERATIELHAALPKAELAALMRKAA